MSALLQLELFPDVSARQGEASRGFWMKEEARQVTRCKKGASC